jgi:hypothetical protein
MDKVIKGNPKDYHDYVIKDGKLAGAFIRGKS